MNNLQALRALCNAIASSFNPDMATLTMVLTNESIDPDGEYTPKDVEIFKLAVSLIIGYVETSRSENGVSVGINEDAIKRALRHWCGRYGLEVDEVLDDSSIRVITDGSNLW